MTSASIQGHEPARASGTGDAYEQLEHSITAEGDRLENAAITALGYEPAYQRVMGKIAGICIVLALASYDTYTQSGLEMC